MVKKENILLVAIIGNICEYYNFSVYSIFAIMVGKTFFPQTSEYVQVLLSLSVFAVGFLTRPVGGIIFGYIGDTFGRRISLIISAFGMAIPTLCMGFLPDYQSIGIVAPVILVLLRLVQGLCLSGEGAGTAIFVLEHYHNLRAGFVTSLVHSSNIFGTVLASSIGIIIEKYFFHVPNAWRYAFLLGGVLGVFNFCIRLKVAETPVFKELQKKKKTLKMPFVHVIKTAWRCMFITFCVGSVASSIVYMPKAYVNIFFHNVLHLDNITSLIYMSYTAFVLIIAMPIFGFLSDKYNKVSILRLSALSIVIFGVPTLKLMGSEHTILQVLSLTMLGILAGSISGAAYIFVISLFKPEERFSGVAFSYNLGIALFGGTSPFISRWLIESTGYYHSPGFYITLTATMFLLVTYIMNSTIKKYVK